MKRNRIKPVRALISVITAVLLTVGLCIVPITAEEENCIKSLLLDCKEISHTDEIKTKTIEIRKKYKTKLPDAIVIVDPRKEEIAIKEARKLNIPVFGVVDTNCDPDMVDYVIPGNDDAVRSVKLMIGVLTNAIAEVNGNEMLDFLKEAAKKEVKEEVKEEAKKEDKIVVDTEVKEEKKAPQKEEKEEKKEEAPKAVEIDFDSMNLTELKEYAKEQGLKGYSKMKKDELLAELKK